LLVHGCRFSNERWGRMGEHRILKNKYENGQKIIMNQSITKNQNKITKNNETQKDTRKKRP